MRSDCIALYATIKNEYSGIYIMAKSIKLNFIYNILYQFLAISLPLITAPYLSRVLGAEQIGEYSYTYSIANYFVLFAMLGITNYGQRCVAKVRANHNELSKVFSEIYTMQLLSCAVVLIAYLLFAASATGNRLLVLLWLPYIISAALDVNWLFFGLEEFGVTVTRNFIIKLASFALTLLLVRGDHALLIYVALMALSFFCSNVALVPFVRKRTSFVCPSVLDVCKHIKPNLLLFIPVIAISVYNILDKVMLGAISDMVQTGYFENSFKVASMPFVFISALGTVMLPRMASLVSEGNRSLELRYLGCSFWIVSVLSFAFLFGILAIAPEFVPVYFGDGFEPCVEVISVIALDLPFMAWANVVRTQYLLPRGRDAEYVLSVVIGALVNVLVNIVAIPRFGALGAGLGTTFAEASVCLVQLWSVRSELPLFAWFKGSIPSLFIGIAMFAAVRMTASWVCGIPIGLLLLIVVGIIVYASMQLAWLVYTKNSYFGLLLSALHGSERKARGRR